MEVVKKDLLEHLPDVEEELCDEFKQVDDYVRTQLLLPGLRPQV